MHLPKQLQVFVLFDVFLQYITVHITVLQERNSRSWRVLVTGPAGAC